MITKLLAFCCRICPFCIYTRRRPDSRFARWFAEMERTCPACKAYRKVKDAERGGGCGEPGAPTA